MLWESREIASIQVIGVRYEEKKGDKENRIRVGDKNQFCIGYRSSEPHSLGNVLQSGGKISTFS